MKAEDLELGRIHGMHSGWFCVASLAQVDLHIFGGLGCGCPCGWKCSLLATVIQLIAPLPPFSFTRNMLLSFLCL